MFTLNYQSRRPIYEQLYQDVLRMAAVGALQPNEKLPTVRALAQQLGINPNTVQKAYQMLERDGVICSITGKGTFLSQDLSAVAQRRELAREGVLRALEAAVTAGIDQAELTRMVEQFYAERGMEP
jgi:GntR family transcriptional regulator